MRGMAASAYWLSSSGGRRRIGVAGLLLGAGSNVATIAFMRKSFGGRATVVGVVALVVSAWAVGIVTNQLTGGEIDVSALASQHSPTWLEYGALAVLGLLSLRTIWRVGMSGFIGAINLSGDHGHGHSHGHDHGHEHSHRSGEDHEHDPPAG